MSALRIGARSILTKDLRFNLGRPRRMKRAPTPHAVYAGKGGYEPVPLKNSLILVRLFEVSVRFRSDV